MATATTNPSLYSAGEFSNILQQNHRLNLDANQKLQITGIDQEVCLELTRARPEEKLDAIEKIFNRILQDQQLRIDDISTEGVIEYKVSAPGSLSILSNSPLEIRVRPWDVAIAFRSLFDPKQKERIFRFLPNQQVIFTDLNSSNVTWADNSGLYFWLSNYLKDEAPQGFTVDIKGNKLQIGEGDNITGLALTDAVALEIRARRTGPTGTQTPVTQAPKPQETQGGAFYDACQFEQALVPDSSSDEEESCTEMLSRWVSKFFSSISFFFSSLFR